MLGCGEDALQKWARDGNSESKQAGEEGMVFGKGQSCRREGGDFFVGRQLTLHIWGSRRSWCGSHLFPL